MRLEGTSVSSRCPDTARTQPLAAFRTHARWAALAAGAGTLVHLSMLGAGGWMALIALGMALACLPCALKMWFAPSMKAAQMLIGMSLGMALLHAAVLLGAMPVVGHLHEVSAVASTTIGDTTHTVPMLAAMGVDFTASILTASWIRMRSPIST